MINGSYHFQLVITFETLSISKSKNLIKLGHEFLQKLTSSDQNWKTNFFVSENHLGFYWNCPYGTVYYENKNCEISDLIENIFSHFKFNITENWPSQIISICCKDLGNWITHCLKKLPILRDSYFDTGIPLNSWSGIKVNDINELELCQNSLIDQNFYSCYNCKIEIGIYPLDFELNLNTLINRNILSQEIKIFFLEDKNQIILCSDEIMNMPDEFLNTAFAVHQDLEFIESKKFSICINSRSDVKNFAITFGKMLYSRFQDLNLLYQLDLKKDLQDFDHNLKDLEFYPQLGTMNDKKNRVMDFIKEFFPTDQLLNQAGKFLYNDRATNIVQEFPELTGIASKIYLHFDEIGIILESALWPINYSDNRNPDSLHKTGLLLGFLDRLDSLSQFAKLNLLPVGSKDPLNIRRITYGAIRLGFYLKLDFNWIKILKSANSDVFNEYFMTRIIKYLSTDPILVRAILNGDSPIWTGEERLNQILEVDFNKIANTFKRLSKFIDFSNNDKHEILDIQSVVKISDEAQDFLNNTYIENPEKKEENIKQLNLYYAKLKTFINFLEIKNVKY